ncbi:MAG: DISARM system phospholipase D-like protein DrmC [Caldilineaceae bacterium]|nr:DISARM system phospholipase D-like protein DrmC [Caldilineaceae bacterium]
MATLAYTLTEHAALIADTLTGEQVYSLAGAISSPQPGPHPGLAQRCYDAVPQLEFRPLVRMLLQTWQTSAPRVSGESVAYLLLGAAASTQRVRVKQRVELIWTGPATNNIPLRRTEQALLETINAAQTSLLIVSFAVYLLESIADAVLAAGRRGVAVDICVESATRDGGANRFDPVRALGPQICRVASIYAWPLGKRSRAENGDVGALHAKCAVADRRLLFISSANLTGHAMDVNMELGVLIHGGRQPGQAADHFRSLIESGQLAEL